LPIQHKNDQLLLEIVQKMDKQKLEALQKEADALSALQYIKSLL
jgi:hypothetical protein